MPVQGSAQAREPRTSARETAGTQGPNPTFKVWLQTWRQVVIAELLHILDGRGWRKAA